MPRPKGIPKTGGRKIGAYNKNTSDIRAMLTEIVISNLDNIQECLDRVAVQNPAKAMELLTRLLDLIVPKPPQEQPAQPQTADLYAEIAKKIMQKIE